MTSLHSSRLCTLVCLQQLRSAAVAQQNFSDVLMTFCVRAPGGLILAVSSLPVSFRHSVRETLILSHIYSVFRIPKVSESRAPGDEQTFGSHRHKIIV